jgi:hydrogenase expression/formation protein HypD
MRFVHEYRDPELAHGLAAEIASLVEPGEVVRVMEICGGHTHAIYRHGLEELLPPEVELVHGPGCPVCVIPMGRVDDAIAIAETDGVTLATFGDMLRVPGGGGSLLEARARGADVRMVYSPLDALELARREPERHVAFLAIGFETTAPATAVTLLRARAESVPNFSVFCNHVLIEPPLRAILDTPGLRVDAFIGPGHVSSVIGTDAYRFIPEEFGRPIVVSAFEP